jgi:hypothetical protein
MKWPVAVFVSAIQAAWADDATTGTNTGIALGASGIF